MTIKALCQPLLRRIARQVERSDLLIQLVKRSRFYKKGSIVWRLNIQKEVVAKTAGIRYRLDLQDDVQRYIYFDLYERKDRRYLLSLIRPGGIYFDIGANVGYYALTIAKKIKNAGAVHAFEASPRLSARLQANCALNPFGKTVIPHQIAVCKEEKMLTFYEGLNNASGWGSLTDYGPDKRAANPVQVQGVSIDDFMETHQIKQIELIKIDVEGHEFDVLEGAKQALKRKAITHLFVEFNGELMSLKNKSFKDFVAYFAAYGYHLSPFNRSLAKRLLTQTIDPKQCVANFHFTY